MSGAPWEMTDTERLRALAAAGLSVPEIAVEMERSRNAIRDWAERLNIAIAKSRHPRQRQTRLETARLQRVDLEAKAKKAQT
jgi:transposase